VLPAERATDPRLRYLRLRRPLEAGFVVTVEPGIYLNEFLVGLRCCGDRAGDRPAPYEGSKEHIDYDVLERYRYVGGAHRIAFLRDARAELLPQAFGSRTTSSSPRRAMKTSPRPSSRSRRSSACAAGRDEACLCGPYTTVQHIDPLDLSTFADRR
jgi:hypothetical protein